MGRRGASARRPIAPWPTTAADRHDRSPRRRAGAGRPLAPRSTRSWRRCEGLGPATAPGQRGRLIFALDATMSRQPTWDTACQLQADMFREAAAIGGLDVQLVYYRGFGECRASRWVSQAERLARADVAASTAAAATPRSARSSPTPARDADQEGAGAGLRRRRHGGEPRRSLPRRRRARPARRAGLHVPGGRRSDRRAGLPRDRAPDARRLLPLRSRARRTSSANCCARPPPMRPAACGRSPICRRGARPARSSCIEQMR